MYSPSSSPPMLLSQTRVLNYKAERDGGVYGTSFLLSGPVQFASKAPALQYRLLDADSAVKLRNPEPRKP